MVFEHISNIKILKDDYSISVYQLTANLICKVISSVGDPFMDSLNHSDGFLPFRRALRRFRELSLDPSKLLFFVSEESRVSDLLTI